MSLARVLGAVLIVCAVVFFVMGFQHSETGVGDVLGKIFTGDFRDGPTWLILGSVTAAVLGLIAMTRPHRPYVGEE
jgi:hypothetical protein